MDIEQLKYVFNKQKFRWSRIKDGRGRVLGVIEQETFEASYNDVFEFLERMGPGTYKLQCSDTNRSPVKCEYDVVIKGQEQESNQLALPAAAQDPEELEKKVTQRVQTELEAKQKEEHYNKLLKELEAEKKELETWPGKIEKVLEFFIKHMEQKAMNQAPAAVQGQATQENGQSQSQAKLEELNKAAQSLAQKFGTDYFIFLSKKVEADPSLVDTLKGLMPMNEK